MKTYTFSAEELAKLELLLGNMVKFHHNDSRSLQELKDFQVRIYPALSEVYYRVIVEKISDDQIEEMSSADRHDISDEEAIRVLSHIFSK